MRGKKRLGRETMKCNERVVGGVGMKAEGVKCSGEVPLYPTEQSLALAQ